MFSKIKLLYDENCYMISKRFPWFCYDILYDRLSSYPFQVDATRVSGQGGDPRQTDRQTEAGAPVCPSTLRYVSARRGPNGHWIYPALRDSVPRARSR